jgi:mono/diheme cytochrome c family protein
MRALRLEPDLRDVIVRGDQLVVSVFRAAKVLVLGADGALVHELTPHDFTSLTGGFSGTGPRAFTPTVAYRSVLLPDGNVAVVHQRSLAEILPTGPSPTGNSYYGGFCSDVVVHAAVTIFDTDSGAVVTNEHAGGVGTLVLPVDIAAAPDGSLAVVGAGSEAVFQTSLARAKASEFIDNCGPDDGQTQHEVIGEPIAVQYGLDGILVQTRQPASLQLIDPVDGAVPWRIDLPGPSRRHVGHALFSRAAGVSSPIACASCHPEGRDDGHVWHFEGIGARRTQSMLGGVLDTVPLHWDGDMTTLHELFDEVFINRMGGVEQDPSHVSQLGEWMQQLPAMIGSRSGDDAAAQRGDALFHDPEVACASCHSGEKLTNNQSVDVGTGRAFQVPSLVGILHRAPFMHDGCAATLHDRFTPECGGDAHGNTAQLSPAQLDDLVAYLETL